MSLSRSLGAARQRLRLVTRLAETWIRRPSSPTRAVIDLTRRCNLRCAMCRTWERDSHRELSAAQLGTVFDAMPRLCWLDLTGGEPMLRRDFSAIVDAALDRLPSLAMLHFQTNGSMPEQTLALVAAARKRRPQVDLIVTVSIDGPAELHDKIRGRSGAFARAIATTQGLQAAANNDPGLQVHVGTTVTAANATAFEDVGALLATLVPGFSVARWHWNVGQHSEHFYGNGATDGVQPDLPDRQLSAAIARHLRRRGLPRSMVTLMESVYLVNLHAVADGAPSKIPCQALRSTVFVSPEGDVYPCHIWDRPLGNVTEHSFATIWRSATVATARREVEQLACGGCFSACEAYPALAGSPVTTALTTLRRAAVIARG